MLCRIVRSTVLQNKCSHGICHRLYTFRIARTVLKKIIIQRNIFHSRSTCESRSMQEQDCPTRFGYRQSVHFRFSFLAFGIVICFVHHRFRGRFTPVTVWHPLPSVDDGAAARFARCLPYHRQYLSCRSCQLKQLRAFNTTIVAVEAAVFSADGGPRNYMHP